MEIGLIGCGNWGKNILRDLLLIGCRVYVADIDPARAEYAANNGAANVYAEAEKLPFSCDGYVVAVSVDMLAKVCAELLKRKKPIFVEKTLCRSEGDIAHLQKLGAEEYVFAMHKWRYHPGIEALRVAAVSGEIGQVRQICTTRTRWVSDKYAYHGGDALYTFLVHDLTIIKHLIGYIPEVLASDIIKDQTGLSVGAIVFLGRDPSVSMNLQTRHPEKRSGICVMGDKGAMELYDAYDDYITLQNFKGRKKIAIDTTFPLLVELKEFVYYLQGGPPPKCNFNEATEISRGLFAIEQISERVD